MNNWLNQIDTTTAAFQNHFGNLSEKELNWKPNPHIWSIAQNIDHMMVINSTYFPIIEALKGGTFKAPFLSKIGFITNFLGDFLLKSVMPSNRKKIKTFPIWEPATSKISGDLLKRFTEHQNELKLAIESSEEFVKEGAVIYSPANKNIVYKLATAFDIIIAHEQRHLEQARELLPELQKNMV